MTKPIQVFISHDSEDAKLAHRLADDLRQLGVRVWIAPESIQPGESWVDAINRGLSESTHMLVILTPAALESRWVRKETDVAIALERQGRMKLIPLDVKPCDVPPLWSSYQMVSFRHDYKTSLRQLVNTLGLRMRTPQLVHLREGQKGCRETVLRRRWPLVAVLATISVTLMLTAAYNAFLGKKVRESVHELTVAHTPMLARPSPSTRTTATSAQAPTAIPTPMPTAISLMYTPRAGEPERGPVIPARLPFEPEMVLIPAGEFLMGSDPQKAKTPKRMSARSTSCSCLTIVLPRRRLPMQSTPSSSKPQGMMPPPIGRMVSHPLIS